MSRAFTTITRLLLPIALSAGAGSLSSCATLAEGHAGLDNQPSARVGPFRLLASGEIGASQAAPFAVNDSIRHLRDPGVVVTGNLDVTAYFAGVASGAAKDAPTNEIVRFDAVDGRSFPGNGTVVLTSTAAWEGGHVGAPSAIHDSSGDTLYYEGASGIGRAQPSGDGTTFLSGSAPVLDAKMIPWGEGQKPKSPAALRMKDGSYRLFFEMDLMEGATIGEARSSDGNAWTVDAVPVLRPGAPGSVDELGVGSPDAVLATSEEGREIVDLYYTATSTNGAAIALAAEFLDGSSPERFERSPSVMLAASSSLAVREPSVVRFDTFTLLFATENASKTSTDPAVIVALAPATETLPPANPK